MANVIERLPNFFEIRKERNGYSIFKKVSYTNEVPQLYLAYNKKDLCLILTDLLDDNFEYKIKRSK
jgi:hypothetical protein